MGPVSLVEVQSQAGFERGDWPKGKMSRVIERGATRGRRGRRERRGVKCMVPRLRDGIKVGN